MNNWITFNDCVTFYLQKHKPEKRIMIFNNQPVTMGNLIRDMDFYTHHLILMGVKPGMGIGYTLPNCPEIFPLFFALAGLGAWALPVFPMIPDTIKANTFKNGQVQWVITSAAQYEALADAARNSEAEFKLATIDPCAKASYSLVGPAGTDLHTENYRLKETDPVMPLLMTTSSGTTGIPKTVVMTQGNGGASVLASVDMVSGENMSVRDDYAAASAFPFSTSGILANTGTMFGGQQLVFSDDISPGRFLQLIAESQPAALSAPPAYFEALAALPVPDKSGICSVRCIFTGMDFLSPALLLRLKEKFVNIDSAVSGYGLVETSLVFMHSKILDENRLNEPLNRMTLIKNIGNSIDVRDPEGNSVADGDCGELYVKGHSVIHGYTGNTVENSACFPGGWFKTGDIVRKETADTVSLLGRKKYIIKRGGRSVSPLVVQNRINTLTGVKYSAVVGIPHRFYGEMIWAFIVKDGNSPIELKDIRSHCRTELPTYMLPDQVTFIDEIPKNPGVGKVNYEKLKQLAIDELKHIEGEEAYV